MIKQFKILNFKFLPRRQTSKISAKRAGFTLVEMIIAIGLFALVSSFSLGAVLSIFDANRKAQSSKTVVDNLNFAVENMTRMIRFGKNYHCGTSGNLAQPNDCAIGTVGGDFIALTFRDNVLGDVLVTYRYDAGNHTIIRSYNGVIDSQGITSPETIIEYVRFYVTGSSASPNTVQPYVIAVIKGYSGNKPTLQSRFVIQTLMSQMRLDI